MRNIEREKRRVETDERKMKAEIKKMAKAGQHVNISYIMIMIESSKNDRARYRQNERPD